MPEKQRRLEAGIDPRDFREILTGVPPGAWVALSHDKTRVVATGNSMKAVTYQADLRGEPDPILIKMPLADEGKAVGAR
jgi:hypothetical protein